MISAKNFGMMLVIFIAVAAASPASASESKHSQKIPQTATQNIEPETFHRTALNNPARKTSALQAVEWLKNGEAVLIDLNSKEQFAHTHLKGAINLPGTDLTDEVLNALVPNKLTRIIVYCTDTLYPTRRLALTTIGAPAFIQLGYPNTTVLEPLYLSKACQKAKKPTEAGAICGNLLPLVRLPQNEHVEPLEVK
jgi:hypothetical protein